MCVHASLATLRLTCDAERLQSEGNSNVPLRITALVSMAITWLLSVQQTVCFISVVRFSTYLLNSFGPLPSDRTSLGYHSGNSCSLVFHVAVLSLSL